MKDTLQHMPLILTQAVEDELIRLPQACVCREPKCTPTCSEERAHPRLAMTPA